MTQSTPDRFAHRANNFHEILTLLQSGDLVETHGVLPWGSNYTFLMEVCLDGQQSLVIYKPQRGERPLWDFPDGTLCNREMGAFVVSEALRWHLVPPTILRSGPQGYGMVQQYIEHDPDRHYFTFGVECKEQLAQIALFDHLINNADRKGGHCLLADTGQIWAIDHGICFHVQPKLRTVIWDFAGQPIPSDLLEDLHDFCSAAVVNGVTDQLATLLTRQEIQALFRRAESLAKVAKYPEPGPGRQYPWPPI